MAIGDAHDASGPCECGRRLKSVYTNITQYVCGVFCGVQNSVKVMNWPFWLKGEGEIKIPGNVVFSKSCESCLLL